MSADNIIYVQKVGETWSVWEQSASSPAESEARNTFPTLEEALLYAHEWEKTFMIVEYGVQLLEEDK